MFIRLRSLTAVAGVAVLLLACETKPSNLVSPSSPEHTQSALVGDPAQLAASGPSHHTVTMFDACDPETFNAALGPGTCTRSGGVQLAAFLEQLGRHGSVGAWHFAPPNVTMRVGQQLVATNRGGEAHTFTAVEEFGGGIVPPLNELMGLTTVAPECGQLTGSDFIAPGASVSETEEEAGVEKYQCCLHPWMRAEVRITEK